MFFSSLPQKFSMKEIHGLNNLILQIYWGGLLTDQILVVKLGMI